MRIREFIRDQFKKRLDAAGCLVVYDGERRYRECVLGLAGETCLVVRFVNTLTFAARIFRP
ncbi:MAG: hypothetical protein FJ398_26995, partial [Verrucomicrobia bacterium]|nr:hypothetical protein [Verrucomicrobiota bacterium]